MPHRRRKRSFTTVDMLISCLCLGLMTVAIVTFASSVNSYNLRIALREQAVLKEYQDVMILESHGYAGYAQAQNDELKLNKGERLCIAKQLGVGETIVLETDLEGLVDESTQRLRWSVEDPEVCSVQNGTVTAIKKGMTVIKVTITPKTGTEGDPTLTQYFPIQVGAFYADEPYAVYCGDYYRYWMSVTDAGAGKNNVRFLTGKTE